eukprot:scaffold618_cov130-Cylindrotheca_fusiformis.AAC.23
MQMTEFSGTRKHRCSFFQLIFEGRGSAVGKARDNNSNNKIKYSMNSSLFAHSTTKMALLPPCMDWIRPIRPGNFPDESQLVLEWTKQADGSKIRKSSHFANGLVFCYTVRS